MIPDWLKWMLIGAGLAAVVFAAFVLVFRNRVARKIRELAEDIAKRKETEKGLRASEEKYRLTLDSVMEGCQIIDFNWRYIYLNEAAVKHGRQPRDKLIGRTMMEAYPGIEATEMFTSLRCCMEDRVPHRFENLFTYPDRSERWFELSMEPVPEGVFVLSIDITERKQAEEALLESQEKYHTLIEASLDPLVTISRSGKITDVNKATEQATGVSREKLIRSDFSDYFTEPDKAREGYNRVFAEGIVRDYPLTLKHSSGKSMDVLYNAAVYRDEGGEVQGVFAAARDITERKKAEQVQERLRQALQAQVSELETFSYGIAHDLKSPLISIEGFTRLLKEDIQNQKAENVKEDMRLLESGVKKMQGFLHSTLEYSRAGRLIKRTPNVSFSEIVNEALQDYNEKISELGAMVTKAKAFPRVNVDRSMMVQVLANLIQNSIKYRDEGVPLKIEIGYETPNGEPVFFVRDNGIGIDAGEVGKVFDLFYRGTSHVEGSGIGLKIAKKIIEAHGGKIWVKEGNAGRGGTTICFTLAGSNGFEKKGFNGKN